MARTSTTWTKGQGGKPKGAKDEVPRSFKATVKAAFERIKSRDPKIVERAIERGLNAKRPRDAFLYVKLDADLQGELKQQVELTGEVTVSDERVREVRGFLDRLAARFSGRGPEAADMAGEG